MTLVTDDSTRVGSPPSAVSEVALQRGQPGTEQVKAASPGGVPGLWHLDNRGGDDEGPQRQVDQEDRTPGQGIGQIAADGRADGGRDRGQALW